VAHALIALALCEGVAAVDVLSVAAAGAGH
jgi:hypothetical protein